MTTDQSLDDSPLDKASPRPAADLWWLPLILGFAAIAVPTLVSLARQAWLLDSGAHGPIVLATGIWLLHYDGLRLRNARPAPAVSWRIPASGLAASLLVYVFGRAYDFISLEYVGLYGVFVSLVWRLFGRAEIRRHAFPIFYLALATPPPGWLIAKLTAPLQIYLSAAAEHVVRLLGYPVARQGVVLIIAQYDLLVEDACSGLNSLFGLIAISLLYIFLMHRASWKYAMLLVAFIVPIALIANLVRVVALILITYYYGDAVAQGFLHNTAGFVVFTIGLLLIFALDKVLSYLLRPHRS